MTVAYQTHPNGTSRSLLFCDLSMFYAPTGGGIRTYTNAKINWFAGQRTHRYLLIHPGPRESVLRPAEHVTIISLPGLKTRSDYRLPVAYPRLQEVVREARPDVLEAGDPWFSGPMGLLFKRRRHVGMLTSFFHGDPIRTYVEPWVARGRGLLRGWLGDHADRWFFRVQRMYDITVASTREVEAMLHRRGVDRTLCVNFGVDPVFLEAGLGRVTHRRRSRLLYVGRLQDDKGVDTLLTALPALLDDPDVHVTIVGSGPRNGDVSRFESPRVRVLGYVDGRQALARVYADHDVLLAPGRYETFGLAALEGLAAGLSVVGPDEGGTGALLHQLESPHLFTPGDATDFVRAVRGAIHADGDAETQAGVALAQRYGTWDQAIGAQVEGYCRHWSHSTT